METYHHDLYGPCLTAFENELRGRVVVLGYAPWMLTHSVARRAQLLNLADWLTRGTLPARIDEALPLVPFVRLSPARDRGAAVLLNAGVDPIDSVTVHVRAQPGPVRLLSHGHDEPLDVQEEESGWRVSLDDLKPWSTTCLLLG
jgi:hypothetical protein